MNYQLSAAVHRVGDRDIVTLSGDRGGD